MTKRGTTVHHRLTPPQALALVPSGTVSDEDVRAAMTPAGSWTAETLAAWGVPWPPPKGWRKRLTEGPPEEPQRETLLYWGPPGSEPSVAAPDFSETHRWTNCTAVPIPANDPRVIVNGRPLPVASRILSEENYQLAMAAVNAMIDGASER